MSSSQTSVLIPKAALFDTYGTLLDMYSMGAQAYGLAIKHCGSTAQDYRLRNWAIP
jgi:hypothetical protein